MATKPADFKLINVAPLTTAVAAAAAVTMTAPMCNLLDNMGSRANNLQRYRCPSRTPILLGICFPNSMAPAVCLHFSLN